MAISFRFEHRDGSRLRARYRHDQRNGPQPGYVDGDRTPDNSTIIPYQPIPELRAMCQERRSTRATKRAMKSNAAIGSTFIITFGKGLQSHVDALSVADQDQLYSAVADAVGKRLGEDVAGLIAHRDETASHAHGVLPAVAKDGRPFSKVINRSVASEIQQIAEDAARPFLPMIEGRKTKAQRIADGEDPSRIYHRTVRQLHDDLPKELAAAQERVAAKEQDLAALAEAEVEAQARVDEMQARVDKLTAKAELDNREIKRLAGYEKRLSDRVAELKAAQAASEAGKIEADRLTEIARADRQAEERRAENIVARIDVMKEAVAAVFEDVGDGTIRRDDKGLLTAKRRDRIEPGFPEVAPAANAAADLVMSMDGARAKLAADQRRVRDERSELAQDRQELIAERAEVATLRDQLKIALRKVYDWMKRKETPAIDRTEGVALMNDAAPLVKSAPAEQPRPKTGGGGDGVGGLGL